MKGIYYFDRNFVKKIRGTMRILITGVAGFVGSNLAEFILSNNPKYEIYGAVRWRSNKENIENIQNRLNLIECEIRDRSSVNYLIKEAKPDLIFHFAGQSSVFSSWHSPADTLNANSIGLINLLESVRSEKLDPLILVAGSGEEYGFTLPSELPISETNPLRPLSPYAVSKVAQDMIGYQYFMNYNLKIIRTRAFNQSGPRRNDIFVESSIAKQIALIEKGRLKPILNVGNIEVSRDFSDVRDVVRGYVLALEKGIPGEVYNICQEKSISIREIINILLSFTDFKIEIKTDPSKLRPSDNPVIIGDCKKFRTATGWQPEIPINKTLQDILNFWRMKINN